MAAEEFAVFDAETTGLFPGRHDRIIEVAIVRVDTRGQVIDEYATLLNPRRDLGPTHVHGLRAGDLLAAPEFLEVAGDVLALLENAVFVAHNASFDLRFLRAEMRRAEIDLPDLSYLCTMRLASAADPFARGRKLCDLCDYFGIDLQQAHSALHDARAAAKLLAVCLKEIPDPLGPPHLRGAARQPQSWPNRPRSGRSLRREESAARKRGEVSYVAGLVSRLPTAGVEDTNVDEYMALIDHVLEDRRITEDEADALLWLAEELQLSREQATAAHEHYLADLIAIALDDGILSQSEKHDLDEVRHLLGITETRAAEILADARDRRSFASGTTARPRHDGSELKGKTICFTGRMTSAIGGRVVDRIRAEQIACEHGMAIRSGVSANLDYLVTADPDSMSRKADAARRYGVRIIAEPVFWQMVGVQTD